MKGLFWILLTCTNLLIIFNNGELSVTLVLSMFAVIYFIIDMLESKRRQEFLASIGIAIFTINIMVFIYTVCILLLDIPLNVILNVPDMGLGH